MRALIDQLLFVLSHKTKASQFDNLIAMASVICAQDPRGLANLIVAILRPVQSERLLAVAERELHGAPTEIMPAEFFAGQSLAYELFRQAEGNRLFTQGYCIDLARHIVFPTPWERGRYASALANIGTGKKCGAWQQDTANHHVVLWLPWGIVFVGGGNHSITAGILAGDGVMVPSEVYDLSSVFMKIRCNGRFYYDVASNIPIVPVVDQRKAAVFEIGRMMVRAGVAAFPDVPRLLYKNTRTLA